MRDADVAVAVWLWHVRECALTRGAAQTDEERDCHPEETRADEDYEWLGVPVEGRLTLRGAHRHQERVVTERLAELLVTAGQPSDAAAVYAELMRDPGPPDADADELDQFVQRQYAFREECARAVFECCRLAGDVAGLTRAYQELRAVLRALAADADVPPGPESTEPGAVTQALYREIYTELARGATAAGD